MVHEIFTINTNRVNLQHVEGISKELQDVLLSPLQDEFYSQVCIFYFCLLFEFCQCFPLILIPFNDLVSLFLKCIRI